MKDNGLEQIKKRLYDLEADPPKDGWKKISATMSSPATGGKLIWLKKNWWLPLALIVPIASVVFLGSDGNGIFRGATSSTIHPSAVSPTTDQSRDEHSISETTKDQVDTSSKEASVQGDKMRGETLVKSDEDGQTTDLAIPTPDGNVQSPQRVGNRQNIHSLSAAADDTGVQPEIVNDEPLSKIGNSYSERRDALVNNDPLMDEASTAITSDSVEAVLELAEEDKMPKKVADDRDDNLDKSSFERSWRITASLIPQYVSRAVRPDHSDEVFLTDIQKKDAAILDNITFGAAIGAGKQLSPNLALDAQLIYSKYVQNISYGFATGNIDTLVAVRQADQSIRIIPMYEKEIRETRSEFKFLGARVGASWYFWHTGKTRFSFNSFVGANYLASTKAEEKRNNNWATVNRTPLSKLTFDVSVGAAYNIRFRSLWELTLNPTLLYHLNEIKSKEAPYHLDHRSINMNITLSRYLLR